MIPKLRLGELLLQAGKLDEAQLKNALDRQKQTGRRLGTVLKDLGYASDEDIARILARQLKLPYFAPLIENVDAAVARRFTEVQVRKLKCMPVGQQGGRLRVVVADPMDWQAVDDLPRLLGGEVDLEIIPEAGLLALVDRLFNGEQNLKGLARQASDDLRSTQAEGIDFTALGLQAGAEDAPIVRLLQGLLDEAVRVRASDVHIEPMAQAVAVRLRVDGHLRLHTELEARLAPAMSSRLKLLAGLDISERRLPQDGRFVVQVRQHPVDIRLSTLPGQHGESLVMRLLVKDPLLARLDRLGIPPRGLKILQSALDSGAGLVLVTGPTGSGKTTTLYAALGALDAASTKILTAEDPVEYRLSGITQVNVQERIGLGFSQVLRAALRQDPDAIMIGEMRDAETVETCIRAAVTGHLVLSTLHTNDAGSAAARLVDMGAPPYMLGSALQAVVAQRLIRRVCPHCAEPATPIPAQRVWLDTLLGRDGWSPELLRQGRGCAHCNGSGYDGRLGIYEVLEMNTDLVSALMGKDMQAFAKAAHAALQGCSLPYEAAQAVMKGQTSLNEALRIGVRLLA
ncbi:MAG: Flp pilus assembly complex ATPase component TadA [Rubrivivax sp.]|nr:Flp pilus assembly complex ATPase component TadA [Rubrivivax sp.]